MSLSLSAVYKPSVKRSLEALSAVLEKAEAHAEAQKIDQGVLLQSRFFPDMLPFVSQIRIACDFSAKAAARLAGETPKSFEDGETSFAELRERIAAALDYIESFSEADLDAGATRDVQAPTGRDTSITLSGADYMLHIVLPNVYFHCTTAYALLRHNGIQLGKLDFVGRLPD